MSADECMNSNADACVFFIKFFLPRFKLYIDYNSNEKETCLCRSCPHTGRGSVRASYIPIYTSTVRERGLRVIVKDQ